MLLLKYNVFFRNLIFKLIIYYDLYYVLLLCPLVSFSDAMSESQLSCFRDLSKRTSLCNVMCGQCSDS